MEREWRITCWRTCIVLSSGADWLEQGRERERERERETHTCSTLEERGDPTRGRESAWFRTDTHPVPLKTSWPSADAWSR